MDAYDSTIVKLDEEFKEGLQKIRGYLMNLTSPQAARCCGEWLQKLRNSSNERELRNVLLQRLTSQVQACKLEFPFDRLPDKSSLYKLYEDIDESSWCTDDYETRSSKEITLTSAETDVTCQQSGGGDACERDWHDVPNYKKLTEPVSAKYLNHVTHTDRNASFSKSRQVKDSHLKKDVKCFPQKNHKSQENSEKKRSETENLSHCIEEYKSMLVDYKRVVNNNLTDLSERLATAIENNHQQKYDLKDLQSTLQDSWTSKLQSLENELIAEVNKLEEQLSSDRMKYEEKIDQLKKKIQEKDDKINSLDCKIKQQGASLKEKMEKVKNEINAAAKEVDYHYKRKYNDLKTQLVKLECMNKELIKQHQKDILMTVKDYEIKLKSARLVAADESMIEVESKVNQLEKSYQKIFQEFRRRVGEKT